MVHVEESELLIDEKLGLTDGLQVLNGGRSLGDDRTDDRRNGKDDNQEDGKLERTEKIPERLKKTTVTVCQEFVSLMGKITWPGEFGSPLHNIAL